MKVPFIDLGRQHQPMKTEILRAIEEVYDSNQFILGAKVKEFEEKIASYVGTTYAKGVSNCTNALLISLRVLGVGQDDEVITTPFTFIATAEVIAILGAKPVFCDIDPKTYNMDPAKIVPVISDRTKVILPVHLYGQVADMDEIMEIARKHDLKVVEDMAQAIGATYHGKQAGVFGDTACISFFPTKNLNALGDAGMILTSDPEIDKKTHAYRVHGASKKYYHDFLGYNDRLDAVQAAVLTVKLKYLDEWNARRRAIAKQYDEGLHDVVEMPYIKPDNVSIYHQYTIRTDKRDALRQYLTDNGIGTAIHYPMPLHMQEAFTYLGHKPGDFPEAERAAREVLSLPIHQVLTEDEIKYVISTIRAFFKK
jgi:dTDP-4-amino-4,6-dideoxygalactose transaminase